MRSACTEICSAVDVLMETFLRRHRLGEGYSSHRKCCTHSSGSMMIVLRRTGNRLPGCTNSAHRTPRDDGGFARGMEEARLVGAIATPAQHALSSSKREMQALSHQMIEPSKNLSAKQSSHGGARGPRRSWLEKNFEGEIPGRGAYASATLVCSLEPLDSAATVEGSCFSQAT